MIKIHNVSTGEVIEREMNAEELAQQEIDKAQAKVEIKAKAQKAADKAALLEKLGITEDEARLLLG
jgi:uncharacterized protein YwgA